MVDGSWEEEVEEEEADDGSQMVPTSRCDGLMRGSCNQSINPNLNGREVEKSLSLAEKCTADKRVLYGVHTQGKQGKTQSWLPACSLGLAPMSPCGCPRTVALAYSNFEHAQSL